MIQLLIELNWEMVFLALEDARAILVRKDQRLDGASCQSSRGIERGDREHSWS